MEKKTEEAAAHKAGKGASCGKEPIIKLVDVWKVYKMGEV